ncbi:response regulator transcription factor [Pseudonocardia spinosispora]|uniref:response regulator transcription factor n=1 Tax=Pseudonocardia spinosispora TaxID=103441 RepID=UPI000429BB4F|nr:response regulator transcription factor [Pseudonocardia spinosispora]
MSRLGHTDPTLTHPLEGQTASGALALRLLVVGDDLPMLELMSSAFRSEGYQVRTAVPVEMSSVAEQWAPHLVAHDGFQVTRFQHGRPEPVPAIFLTSGDQLHGTFSGLAVGGGLYLTKSFSLEDLLAGARSVLRSAAFESTADDGVLRFADLELDEETYDVRRSGRSIQLTPTEFKLLRFLLRRTGKVLTKTHILDHVWPYDYSGDPKIVELYVFKLRRKIDRFHPPLMHTLRGLGYSLRAQRS